jgi:hypothetical protein
METKQREPRYRKDGQVYKQDAHLIGPRWPMVPAYQPGAVAASLAAPDPLKRKGRC